MSEIHSGVSPRHRETSEESIQMTEDEKRSFFTLSSSRAPGKRQIKPNANILFDAIPLSDSDEDDDFIG
uniref:Uncharacterized protein n=1 Tax=Brugia malayi TaxID=6279 RepID=A8PFI5_BRUMA